MRSEEEIRAMLRVFQEFAHDRYAAEKDALKWVLGEYPEKPAEIVHGVNCPKVPHTVHGMLHAADDDRPYDVDGVKYCGRCHQAL